MVTKRINTESTQLYDTVNELMAALKQKYTLFSVKRDIVNECLGNIYIVLFCFVMAIFITIFGVTEKQSGFVLLGIVGFFISLVGFFIHVLIIIFYRQKFESDIYKYIIYCACPDGIYLSDAEHTFIGYPAHLKNTLELEYFGKEGAEIGIVASENLKDIYGIEYKGQILML